MFTTVLTMTAQVIVLFFALYFAMGSVLTNMIQVRYRVISFVVLLCILWLGLHRDTYLPFLGSAAFPASLVLSERVPDNANIQVIVPMPGVADGTKLLYWGAQPESKEKAVAENPWTAYSDYTNAGVTTVREGMATIRFNCPGRYKVPLGIVPLKRHLHYRLCCEKNTLLGPVRTLWVKC
jgi:hypothetical protein